MQEKTHQEKVSWESKPSQIAMFPKPKFQCVVRQTTRFFSILHNSEDGIMLS